MHRAAVHTQLFLLTALSILLHSGTAASAEPLARDEFVRLRELLQPAENELWRMIPWRLSVLEGQQAAARQHKPIFIWAMDGHPLGCT
ncbi:MAG: hypothetical protein FJ295_06020 [Planctomycetes bacterium]|nr:hypothetical protein [Planctomycetota bacterium]